MYRRYSVILVVLLCLTTLLILVLPATASQQKRTVDPYPGAPLCTDHDSVIWHGLWDPIQGCRYDHEHKDNPHDVDDLFGSVGAWYAGQGLSYPWQTFSGANDQYPPPPPVGQGLYENESKHQGYGWIVRRDVPTCTLSNAPCTHDLRLQFHAVMGPLGAVTRFHSGSMEVRILNSDGSYGIGRLGGWYDFSCLFVDSVHVPLQSDPITCSLNVRRRHFSDNALAFWYGEQNTAGQPVPSRFVINTNDAWGPVDAANPATPLFFCPDYRCSNNGSNISLQQLIVSFNTTLDTDSDGWLDGSYYTDRYGNLVTGCSTASLDCIPLILENVEVGSVLYQDGDNGIPSPGGIDYDSSPTDEWWVTYLAAPPAPPSSAVSGLVFADVNRDGQFDVTVDYSVPDIQVDLTPTFFGNIITTTSTIDGSYQMNGLLSGVYDITIADQSLPPGYTNFADDSIALQFEQSDVFDFPLQVNTVSGMLYQDLDFNSMYDALVDAPYPGRTVALTGSSGISMTTTTDNAGLYAFHGLVSDTYTISVASESLDPNWFSVIPELFGTVGPLTEVLGANFPIQYPSASVSGRVFGDLIFNGLYEPPAEVGLADVEVILTKENDGTIYTTTSDFDGLFNFTTLVGGLYALEVNENTLPPGHFVQSLNLRALHIVLTNGQNMTKDVPISLNSVGGFVYQDNNVNGMFDSGIDAPYPDVIIDLEAPDGTFTNTVTASDGIYAFRAVAAGTYTLTVNTGSLDPGWSSLIPRLIRTVSDSSQIADIDFPIEPPVSGGLFVSSVSGGTIGNLTYRDEDILNYNSTDDLWTMYFDASDLGVTADVNAFAVLADGSILMSFDVPVTLPGIVGTVDDSDIVHFIPTQLGQVTVGTFEFYFDGSDVDLLDNGEDIDALAILADGSLLISTKGRVRVNGNLIAGRDEDIVLFTPTTLGENTSGSWQMYFDGSDVALDTTNSEDVAGVWVDPTGQDIYLTTEGAFAVNGAGGDGADVFVCHVGTTGDTTTCTFGPGLHWDGSLHGFDQQVVDGISLQ